MQGLGPLVRVCQVKRLQGFRVRIRFDNGTEREIDLEPYLHGPIFESIRNDPQIFGAMKMRAEGSPGKMAPTLIPMSLITILSRRGWKILKKQFRALSHGAQRNRNES